jgi:hypothetical protein
MGTVTIIQGQTVSVQWRTTIRSIHVTITRPYPTSGGSGRFASLVRFGNAAVAAMIVTLTWFVVLYLGIDGVIRQLSSPSARQ